MVVNKITESPSPFEDEKINETMKNIHHKILVMSGKGGVGKSTVSVNIAIELLMRGKTVGILDTDLHGPNVARLLGIENVTIETRDNLLVPVEILPGLRIMSISFLLASDSTAVIWRGPKKTMMIKQFLSEVIWGELDYLIIDLPPGTGDESISVIQFISDLDGAVIVTTSSEVSLLDCSKAIHMAKMMNVAILGIIENMSEVVCPKCGERSAIFGENGGNKIAELEHLSFLGKIPIIPKLNEKGSHTNESVSMECIKYFSPIVDNLINQIEIKTKEDICNVRDKI